MTDQTDIYTFKDNETASGLVQPDPVRSARPQPLLEMLNQLESAAAMCEGDFAALMERLSPLLPPMPEDSDPEAVADHPGGSSVFCRLHSLLGRLMALDVAIEDLTNRLEV